jgi:AcrR family transcriptional regulator
MGQDDSDAQVRRLWRHRGTTLPTPRRGPRQQLSLDELLDTAVALADAGGLAAVSTRAVAAAFGKTPMALYPYVGTKANLLELLRDHVSALPAWPDPGTSAADDLTAWGTALFDLYAAHPWLASESWARTGRGPNERDWLERLLGILHAWHVPPAGHAPIVTVLYATVRACAETDADYRRLGPDGAAEWLAHENATRRHIPDLAGRYPLTAALTPVTPDWRQNPRATIARAAGLLTATGR